MCTAARSCRRDASAGYTPSPMRSLLCPCPAAPPPPRPSSSSSSTSCRLLFVHQLNNSIAAGSPSQLTILSSTGYPRRPRQWYTAVAASACILLLAVLLSSPMRRAIALSRLPRARFSSSSSSKAASLLRPAAQPTLAARSITTIPASRMVTAPEAVGLAAASGSGSGAAASPDSSRGYATVASTTSHSTAIPSDPYAPSLSHLNGSELPHGYERVASSSYATFSRPIEQSPNDDRSYRLVRLDNGLECLLVSDPKTDKCAAGISVRVGHLSDPENAQGMAHFCEHLLFMGTEKVCLCCQTILSKAVTDINNPRSPAVPL